MVTTDKTDIVDTLAVLYSADNPKGRIRIAKKHGELTRTIAQFIVDTEASSIPPAVYEHAKVAFLDWFAVTIAGRNEPLVLKLPRFLQTIMPRFRSIFPCMIRQSASRPHLRSIAILCRFLASKIDDPGLRFFRNYRFLGPVKFRQVLANKPLTISHLSPCPGQWPKEFRSKKSSYEVRIVSFLKDFSLDCEV